MKKLTQKMIGFGLTAVLMSGMSASAEPASQDTSTAQNSVAWVPGGDPVLKQSAESAWKQFCDKKIAAILEETAEQFQFSDVMLAKFKEYRNDPAQFMRETEAYDIRDAIDTLRQIQRIYNDATKRLYPDARTRAHLTPEQFAAVPAELTDAERQKLAELDEKSARQVSPYFFSVMVCVHKDQIVDLTRTNRETGASQQVRMTAVLYLLTVEFPQAVRTETQKRRDDMNRMVRTARGVVTFLMEKDKKQQAQQAVRKMVAERTARS